MSDVILDWQSLQPIQPLRLESDALRLVAQRVLVTLNTAAGTWWLDGSFGLRLQALWLRKSPDLRLVEADLRRVVTRVPGVLRIASVTLRLDRVARLLRVDMAVVTSAGVLTVATVEGSGEVGDVLAPSRFYLLMSGPGGPLGLAAGLVAV